MSKLKAKDPTTAEPSKPKMLIYGKPGVGKTWGSLDFPSCYYIDTEGGANLSHYIDKLKKSGGVYMGPEDGALDFRTIVEQVQALATEQHSYRTLIVDSISKLYNTAISNEADRLGDRNAFGADKKPAIAWMRRLVSWISKLDMNVLFIAHSKSEWGTDAKGDRVEIGQTFDAWDKLEYELHLCLEIIKRGPERTARVRKSRLLGFPDADIFPWSYPTFAERYGKDIIEAKSKAIVLATQDQVSEVMNLLDSIKVDPETVEKWFTKAGVVGFSEMTSSQIQGCITFLKKKIK
jgi:hypothetical protein